MKTIYDNIHGHIKISKLAMKIIDTPEFQRLRNIKQLGLIYLVFPSAIHTRFEHSLGVYYLASKILKKINVTKRKKELIKIAGLIHDLGHGPFSHIFDDDFLKNNNSKYKYHENRSMLLFKHIVSKYKIDINEKEIEFINTLIQPTKDNVGSIYQIISNKVNDVDVDKFDYIMRDTYNIGLKYGLDYERIIKNIKIIDDNICFPIKVSYDIQQLFATRYKLHKQIYNHPVCRSIELMICEALKIADGVFNISESIDDPESFYKLNDNILDLIINSDDERLIEAQRIINDVKMRRIYNYVGEIITDSKMDDIEKYIDEDVIIDVIFIGYVSGNKTNPLENIHYYKKNKTMILKNENISLLISNNYQEYSTRFYAKNKKDIKKVERIITFLEKNVNQKKLKKLINSSIDISCEKINQIKNMIK